MVVRNAESRVQLQREPLLSMPVLTRETRVKSRYEEVFRTCLLEADISSSYEPFRFYLHKYSEGKEITYTPDFVTELTVNGKTVLLEPHPMRSMPRGQIVRDLSKFHSFMELAGKQYHLVLASDLPPGMLKQYVHFQGNRFFSEYWQIPHLPFSGDDQELYGAVRGYLRSMLQSLKRDGQHEDATLRQALLLHSARGL